MPEKVKEDEHATVRTYITLPQSVIESAIRSYMSVRGLPIPVRISFHGGSTDEGDTPITAEFETKPDEDLEEKLRTL